jgi:hypothetical protein
MNERIKQITGQVLDEIVPETWTALGYDKIKDIQNRTAELIIKECGYWIINNAGIMEHLGPEYFVQAMIKDFGVK